MSNSNFEGARSRDDRSNVPLNPEELETLTKPKVLISGAGLGGLTLAILLHKAKIPFLVLEKAYEVKPLGSALVIGTGAAPLLRQMGVYEDFLAIAKHQNHLNIMDENLKPQWTLNYDWLEDIGGGYKEYIVARPDLYNVLWNHVPRDRIHLGKRVLSFQESENQIQVHTSDNSLYHGDILVGADGAYSAVRQHLYKTLKATDDLPKSDDVALPYKCVCLVGQTDVLSPDEFPEVGKDVCQFSSILGLTNMCTNDSFRNSEWGPEAAVAMCNEWRHLKVPGGQTGELTLGDYIDRTPKEYIAKVMLEEIVFDTWYSGRTVLLGDACHKMNPTGGVGALMAISDAVTLANWISTLDVPHENDLKKIFKQYKAERYPAAKEAFQSSQLFTKTLGKGMLSVFVRSLMKRLPLWLWRRMLYKSVGPRPQASFLAPVEDNGSLKPFYQHSLQKTLAIRQERGLGPVVQEEQANATAV
ncbi:hypothetical protein BG006_005634 [Podila minutissima]|uniref:FAD-binding domain-containing protein n=1 Tax=Podila minutissima TaxID=64525 RepID=A0A9P5SM91_9FUNG|nr:hypothetical protein BG006_005634 [Podila minutissima]